MAGDVDKVRALLQEGADVNHHCDGTALTHASLNGHDDCVVALLDGGAALHLHGQRDLALLMASDQGHHACVCALLESGTPSIRPCRRGARPRS